MADSLEQIADQLYGVTPAEFVAARDEQVARARVEDRELADRIGELRRPTQSAWLVNLLWRERRDQVVELLDLGERFRAAHRSRAADQIRDLSGERQRKVGKLAAQAQRLATDAGSKPSASAVREVEHTLEAAVADPDVADRVRTGRLTKPESYAGFGPVGSDDMADLSALFDTAETPRGSEAALESKRESRKVIEARDEVDRTTEQLAAAETAAEEASTSRDALRERIRETQTELRKLEHQLTEAERALRTEEQRTERARAAVDNARHRLRQAEA